MLKLNEKQYSKIMGSLPKGSVIIKIDYPDEDVLVTTKQRRAKVIYAYKGEKYFTHMSYHLSAWDNRGQQGTMGE